MKKSDGKAVVFGLLVFFLLTLIIFLSQKNQSQNTKTQANAEISFVNFTGPVKIYTHDSENNLKIDVKLADAGIKPQEEGLKGSKELAENFLRGVYVINDNSISTNLSNVGLGEIVDLSKYQFQHQISREFSNIKKRKEIGEFFSQSINGVPVYHSFLRVDTGEGSVLGVEGEIVSDTDIVSGSKNLSELQNIALQKGRNLENWQNLVLCNTPQKVIFNSKLNRLESENKNYEAYLLDLCNQEFPVMRYIISTQGQILEQEAQIFDQSSVTVKDCSKGSNCPVVQKAGSSGDATKAFTYFDESQSYFSTRYSENIPNSSVTVNDTKSIKCPNAASNGNNVMTFCPGMLGKDVYGHELSHGIVGRSAGLVYSNQSGALNESYADIFGWAIDDDDWTIGEDTTLGVLRSFSNPASVKRAQPSQVYDSNYYCGNDSGAFVHINSGVLNHAFYLSVEGGSKNNIQVNKVAKEVVQDVYYQALVKYLNPNSNFCDAYKAIIKSCNDKTDANNCTQIKSALEAVQMHHQSPSDRKGMYCSSQKSPPATPACVLTSGGGGGGASPAATIAASIVPASTSVPNSPPPSGAPTRFIPLPTLNITPGNPIKIDITDPSTNKIAIKQVTFKTVCTAGYQEMEFVCADDSQKTLQKNECLDVNTLVDEALKICASIPQEASPVPNTIVPSSAPTSVPISPATKFKIIWL